MKPRSDAQWMARCAPQVVDLRRLRGPLPKRILARLDWLLGHPDYGVREAAIRAAGRSRDVSLLPRLRRALHERAQSDYALQVAAAEALGELGHPSAIAPLLREAWQAELLNVRRAARRELDRLLAARALRGRRGFGPAHDRILNVNHECPPGSDSIHARQIDEQIRLTAATAPMLYGTPAFCRYAAGARPALEHAVDLLAPRAAAMAETARVLIERLATGMADRTPSAAQVFHRWWQAAADGVLLLPEWEEESFLAVGTGSCDRLARCLIALCRTRQIPGRLVIWYHANGKRQHVMAELFLDGQWRLRDPLLGLSWQSTAWDLLGRPNPTARASVVRPVPARRRELTELFAPPGMFSQAGIVPVDRMGIDP